MSGNKIPAIAIMATTVVDIMILRLGLTPSAALKTRIAAKIRKPKINIPPSIPTPVNISR